MTTNFKSDTLTRLDRRRRATVELEAARRTAYREAERRDGFRCRVCKCHVVKTLSLQPDRLEHHHLDGRGIGRETAENVIIICRECHDARHVRRTLHLSWGPEGAHGRIFAVQDGHGWHC